MGGDCGEIGTACGCCGGVTGSCCECVEGSDGDADSCCECDIIMEKEVAVMRRLEEADHQN